MSEADVIIAVLAGIFVGGALGWFIATSKWQAEVVGAKTRLESQQSQQGELGERLELMQDRFKSLAGDVLKDNSDMFLKEAKERLVSIQNEGRGDLEKREQAIGHLVKPLKEQLEKLESSHKEMEKGRSGAYQDIKSHIEALMTRTDALGREANNLSTALTKGNQVRGDWGELNLRKLLEDSGMLIHSDFDEQKGIEGGGRPDVVIKLPGDGVIPIDAKATAKHYFEAFEVENEVEKESLLKEHAKAMRGRVVELDRRDYRDNIKGRAQFVVMYVPSEGLLTSAFQQDPELYAYAMTKEVLIASPVSLMALLRTAALYWQQVEFAENAEEVINEAKEFYSRMATWSTHFSKMGKQLDGATKAYNKAANSWQTRVMVQGKRLEELKVAENINKQLESPSIIEDAVSEPLALGQNVSEADEGNIEDEPLALGQNVSEADEGNIEDEPQVLGQNVSEADDDNEESPDEPQTKDDIFDDQVNPNGAKSVNEGDEVSKKDEYQGSDRYPTEGG